MTSKMGRFGDSSIKNADTTDELNILEESREDQEDE